MTCPPVQLRIAPSSQGPSYDRQEHCALSRHGEARQGRLVKHARYYWFLLAEGHLTRRLFSSMLRTISALPLPDGQRPRREGNFRCSVVVGPDKCQRRGKLGRAKPHSDSAERPKRAALPPQRGLGDLRLTRQGRRQGFRVKGKLKMEIPEKINLSNRPRRYHHEA